MTGLDTTRGGADPLLSPAVLHTLKVGLYFGLWYALNVVYNSTCVIFVRVLESFVLPFFSLQDHVTSPHLSIVLCLVQSIHALFSFDYYLQL